MRNGGGIWTNRTTNLTNSTVANNSAAGSGSAAGVLASIGTVTTRNSIIAGNQNNNTFPDVVGTAAVISGGYNLIGNTGAVTGFNQTGDQTGTGASPLNPMIAALADNGGATRTHALLANSPAIDKGSSSGSTTDQRGLIRPADNLSIPNTDDGADIGAFEMQNLGSTNVINVSIPANLTASQNSALTVPVNVSNTTGSGITSFDFRLNYDATVLMPLATPVETSGTLASQFEVNVSNSTAGTLLISGFGTAPLTGAGVLLNFKFNAVGAFPACSVLTLTNFGFNEGNPSATVVSGQACITGATVSGAINYGTAAIITAVPDVTLTAAGTPNLTTTTGAGGVYNLTGFGAGAYTVTPSKTGDVNGAITSFDASQISKYLVQTATLTPQQLAAADVSGNGAVTSFDASLIAQTVLGIPNAGNAGTWRFTPSNRTYPNLTANLTGQDYTAILMGEVSGNWTPPTGLAKQYADSEAAPEQSSIDAVAVNLPIRNVGVNAEFAVPVIIGDTTGRDISSFDFELSYDSSVIEPLAQAVSNAETLSGEFAVAANVITPGKLRVSGYSASNLTGSGTLVNLKFRAIGQTGMSSALTWNNFLFNEGSPTVIHTNGRISINSLVARTRFDFDGDGRADISVFRPNEGIWYLNNSASGFSALRFGFVSDKLVPEDYDGDGKTDIAVYRSGTWYLQRSSQGFVGIVFGAADDIPVPADYDGDGKAAVAVFRPSNGSWYLLQSSAGFTGIAFGLGTDKPIPADYDGDGKAEVAVFRPSNGTWYTSTDAAINYGAFQFGAAEDEPVSADYDGDGKTDIAVFRPSNGIWYLQRSREGFIAFAFGFNTDLPVPADYDGDGKADISVFRNGVWHLNRSSQGLAGVAFGTATDRPILNAFVR